MERLDELAADLVGLKVDVIVASNTQSIDATRRATKTIPIVFPVTFDPVASGFVAASRDRVETSRINHTQRRSRANVSSSQGDHAENFPRGVLETPLIRLLFALKETEAAANHLGIRMQVLEVRGADQLEGAIKTAIRERAVL